MKSSPYLRLWRTALRASEYYDFVDAENEEDFNSYVGKCKELALYDTGVTAEYGDRLITLSTCEYVRTRTGRLVVVAKKRSADLNANLWGKEVFYG